MDCPSKQALLLEYDSLLDRLNHISCNPKPKLTAEQSRAQEAEASAQRQANLILLAQKSETVQGKLQELGKQLREESKVLQREVEEGRSQLKWLERRMGSILQEEQLGICNNESQMMRLIDSFAVRVKREIKLAESHGQNSVQLLKLRFNQQLPALRTAVESALDDARHQLRGHRGRGTRIAKEAEMSAPGPLVSEGEESLRVLISETVGGLQRQLLQQKQEQSLSEKRVLGILNALCSRLSDSQCGLAS